jgi:hypothetical protein
MTELNIEHCLQGHYKNMKFKIHKTVIQCGCEVIILRAKCELSVQRAVTGEGAERKGSEQFKNSYT